MMRCVELLMSLLNTQNCVPSKHVS